MLIDEAKIIIEAGKGGNGIVSFRHEKYVAKGGPDGGDGGEGGSVYIEATTRANTLGDFIRIKSYKAPAGASGGPNKRHGKNGDDLTLYVPVGTIIADDNKTVADLVKDGQKYLIAKGGQGGLGNVHFSTSTNRTPKEAKPGEPGEKKDIALNLKLIADVGLIGLPNAGKSTLLSVLSRAKPKVADYPFTTLEPVLGVASYKDRSIVIADIPGLIEGASSGKGLGHQFLRHIERTKALVHLIDGQSDDPQRDYNTIREELAKFNKKLLTKNEIVVLTKIDTIKKPEKKFKADFYISAATGEGIQNLLQALAKRL